MKLEELIAFPPDVLLVQFVTTDDVERCHAFVYEPSCAWSTDSVIERAMLHQQENGREIKTIAGVIATWIRDGEKHRYKVYP
jgi:hypothetical protein